MKQALNTFFTETLYATRACMIFGILLYGAAILQLDIYQKIVASTFWSICKSKFIYTFLFFILFEDTQALFGCDLIKT